jgi:hypothetical protein
MKNPRNITLKFQTWKLTIVLIPSTVKKNNNNTTNFLGTKEPINKRKTIKKASDFKRNGEALKKLNKYRNHG